MKKQKIMMDAAAKADQQALKEQEVSGKLELEALRTGAQIKESEFKQQFEQERAGLQMGADIAKSKAQMALQARTAALSNSGKQREPKS